METSVTQPLVLRQKSRSSRFANWSGEGNRFYDKMLRVLYIFLLIAINFVMFIYSINGKIIEDGVVNQAVLAILGGVGVAAFALIILLSFSRDLQNIICAVITMVMIAFFFYQFALFDVDNFIETWLNSHASWLTFLCLIPSAWLVGLFCGIIIFFAFRYTYAMLFVTIVLLSAGLMGIKNNEFVAHNEKEYSEVKRMPNLNEERKDNLVYFMIPKFPSYQFLNTIRDRNFRELRDIMVGFYSVNDFEIYPNAFIMDNDTKSNVVDIFNQVDYTSTTSQNRGYSEFINEWEFIKGSLDYWSLDENRLYDHLHGNQYMISTYSMPGFNLCLKNNEMNTDRCMIKNYKYVSLYDKKKSLEANVYWLLSEWLMNLKIRDFKPIAKSFARMSSIKGHRVTSENQRQSIIGVPELFSELNMQFSTDKNGKVYMVYVDLPSDIYIYDEYCRIKPKNEWVALKDNSFVSGGIDEKRKAYADQAKCTIGLLQLYVDEMYKSNKSYQTDVIIQGVSTIRELAGMTAGRYGNFVKDNLVSLAIRKSKKPKFLINANICLASDFTKTLIRYQDYCYTIDNMTMPSEEMLNLKKNLINNSIFRGNKISNIAANYKYWYEEFKKHNPIYLKSVQEEVRAIQKREEAKRTLDEENKNEKSGNIFLPSDALIIEMDDDGELATSFENESELLENSEEEQPVESEVLVPTVAPKVEVKAVAPTVAPKAEVKEVAPTVAPKAEVKAVAPTVAPKAKVKEVAPTVAPKVEVKAVAPTVAPKTEVKAVAPTVAPKAEVKEVAPTVAPKVEVKAVAPTVAPKVEVKAVAPTVAPKTEVKAAAPKKEVVDPFAELTLE